MRNYLLLLLGTLFVMSCDVDEESISTDPSLIVVFSNDSVAFDTLLSSSRSPTKRLTVFNPNKSAIQFSSISLGFQDQSEYSVIINGKSTSSVLNETLLGGDSLLILVSAALNPRNQNDPFLVKDSIIFNWNSNSEHVKLIAYGQDGNRRMNETICNEVWTKDRPYIIKDTLLVARDCELRIEEGTKIYFENDAVLFIQGTLAALGDSANHIEFRNARFDGVFNNVPGQWNGIYFLEGSTNNQVLYTDIYNAQIGLRVGTPDEDLDPDLIVSNTRIFNMSFAGILGFTSDIMVTNTLIYNCGTYLVGNFAGGFYSYEHCTFSNEPSPFVRDEPSVQFADNIVVGEQVLTEDLTVKLKNSIIWGTSNEELLINDGGGSTISLDISDNIIRSENEYQNNYTSTEFNFPGFKDIFQFDYALDTLSFAMDRGGLLGIEVDINGQRRDTNPDIGAFERIEK